MTSESCEQWKRHGCFGILVMVVALFVSPGPMRASETTLDLLMKTPRLETLSASVALGGEQVAQISLNLRYDEKGKIVNGGECLVDGAAVDVKGKIKTKGAPVYNLKLKGRTEKISVKIQGVLEDGVNSALVKFKSSRGKATVPENEVTLLATSTVATIVLNPKVDARGRLSGTAVLNGGFGQANQLPGTLKGKIKGEILSFTVKLNKESLKFKGLRLGDSTEFSGPLSYKMLPEKDSAPSYGVDLGLFCRRDLDCDSLTDADEIAGWDVTVTLADGTQKPSSVTSDPAIGDTDGDGLDDGQERAAGIDPRHADTDADGLSDASELQVFKSNPLLVDSDGDSRGPGGDQPTDPNLWDGNEIDAAGTSPTLADTDGDNFTDWEEINVAGNPLIADLPELDLRVFTDAEIVLNVTSTATEQHILSTLEQKRSEYQKTDTVANRTAIENTVHIHSEVEAGTGSWPPSASVKMTTDTRFEHSYVNETSSSWTKSSVDDSKNTYNLAREQVTQFQNGIITVGMKIVNNSNVAVRLSEPRVIATRFTPGGSFRAVGTLGPGDMEYDAFTLQQNWIPEAMIWEKELAPGEEIIVQIGDGGVPAQVMEELIRDPTALMFEIASYTLTSPDGSRNYVEVGQDVIARTGVIVIDYGDGVVDRHAVATNVFRNPDGSGAGVTLARALGDIIGTTYATCAEERWQNCVDRVPTGRSILCELRNQAAYGACRDHQRGFWLVGGNGVDFDNAVGNFEDIVIHNGERVSLVWIQDTDGDGLFDREEYLLGTGFDETDSDGDGMDDYAESRLGWQVAVEEHTPYHVYSDPRFVDADSDSLTDDIEELLGTDPYRSDTDSDGDPDNLDPDPLEPPCLEGTQMLLAAWWDCETEDIGGFLHAADLWAVDGFSNDGLLSSPGMSIAEGDNKIFRFVNLQASADYITVENDNGIGPTEQYTLSVSLNFGGVGNGEEWGLVFAKGETDRANYALYVAEDGRLKHTLYRNYYTKCVQCSLFGCSDPLCADDSGKDQQVQITAAGVIEKNRWTHVAATYVDQTMTVYVDGEPVHQQSTRSQWQNGLNHRTRTTTSLVRNNQALRIGGDPELESPQGPYRGLVDDAQIFNRGLNAGQIKNLGRFGTCSP